MAINLLPTIAKTVVMSQIDAEKAYTGLIDSWKQYQEIKQREMTRREAIRADRDIALANIKAQKDILELYLNRTFDERKHNFERLFKTLDIAIKNDNLELMNGALSSIVEIAKTSPLAQARQLLADVKDPNVKSIDW